ncbi:MAG TPA: hypothetical protein VIJ23_09250 [Mycobacterium sp.]
MTTLLLVFAAVLLLAVLLSNLAKRTILSTAVIFLVAVSCAVRVSPG